MNDDLPVWANGNTPPVANSPASSGISTGTVPGTGASVGGGISGKEREIGGSSLSPDFQFSGPGVEMELPKEVIGAGVKMQPTSIKIPPPVQSMGVKATGISAPMSNGSSVTLPLTDTEIAEGMKQNITSSLRWLSEWCIFQLKKIGLNKK